MRACDYCSESFDDTDTYLQHLEAEHREELGPIDQRRLGLHQMDEDGFPPGLIVLGVVFGVTVVIAGYAIILMSNAGTGNGPVTDPDVHYHGTMEIIIDGETLDLSGDSAFVGNDRVFHFHGNEHDRHGAHIWHVHGEGVTLQYALDTLSIDVNDNGSVLIFAGTTYDETVPDTTVTITVNDNPVTPGEYILQGVGPLDQAAAGEGDDVLVVVETT